MKQVWPHRDPRMIAWEAQIMRNPKTMMPMEHLLRNQLVKLERKSTWQSRSHPLARDTDLNITLATITREETGMKMMSRKPHHKSYLRTSHLKLQQLWTHKNWLSRYRWWKSMQREIRKRRRGNRDAEGQSLLLRLHLIRELKRNLMLLEGKLQVSRMVSTDWMLHRRKLKRKNALLRKSMKRMVLRVGQLSISISGLNQCRLHPLKLRRRKITQQTTWPTF